MAFSLYQPRDLLLERFPQNDPNFVSLSGAWKPYSISTCSGVYNMADKCFNYRKYLGSDDYYCDGYYYNNYCYY